VNFRRDAGSGRRYIQTQAVKASHAKKKMLAVHAGRSRGSVAFIPSTTAVANRANW
jgi:hypothetical protein